MKLVGWPADDAATGLAFPFPDLSVNRSKYCAKPEWVLLPNWVNDGVIAFRVMDIPSRLEQSGTTYVFEFRTVHDPEDDNYSHTEVRTYRNGMHDKKIEPPKTIRKKFRQMLAESAHLVHPARH